MLPENFFRSPRLMEENGRKRHKATTALHRARGPVCAWPLQLRSVEPRQEHSTVVLISQSGAAKGSRATSRDVQVAVPETETFSIAHKT